MTSDRRESFSRDAWVMPGTGVCRAIAVFMRDGGYAIVSQAAARLHGFRGLEPIVLAHSGLGSLRRDAWVMPRWEPGPAPPPIEDLFARPTTTVGTREGDS